MCKGFYGDTLFAVVLQGALDRGVCSCLHFAFVLSTVYCVVCKGLVIRTAMLGNGIARSHHVDSWLWLAGSYPAIMIDDSAANMPS